MKLKNKKTGEIFDYRPTLQRWNGPIVNRCNYNSLAELNAEWEDYEEPKTLGWRIDEYNEPEEIGFGFSLEELEYLKEIGLWFKTEEEAKKAVEKLKAWKRLKDTYHIRFALDFIKNNISFTYRIDDTSHSVLDEEHIVYEYMKTILGGEK